MSIRLSSAFFLAATLVACGEAAPPVQDDFVRSLVVDLVQRFDVPTCADAQLIRAGRNPDERKPGGQSVYLADEACIADMKRSLPLIGFEQSDDATYRYTSEQGWAELVQLTRTGDGQAPVIIWERIDP